MTIEVSLSEPLQPSGAERANNAGQICPMGVPPSSSSVHDIPKCAKRNGFSRCVRMIVTSNNTGSRGARTGAGVCFASVRKRGGGRIYPKRAKCIAIPWAKFRKWVEKKNASVQLELAFPPPKVLRPQRAPAKVRTGRNRKATR